MKTAYSCFILIALTLYTALGHADSYTDLAADWEDWSPPAYPVPPSGAQDDPTDPPPKQGRSNPATRSGSPRFPPSWNRGASSIFLRKFPLKKSGPSKGPQMPSTLC